MSATGTMTLIRAGATGHCARPDQQGNRIIRVGVSAIIATAVCPYRSLDDDEVRIDGPTDQGCGNDSDERDAASDQRVDDDDLGERDDQGT